MESIKKQVEKICGQITVVPLDEDMYYRNPVLSILSRKDLLKSREISPVCVYKSKSMAEYPVKHNRSFQLFTFDGWLRSGFRIVPEYMPWCFEVYKGFGLAVPEESQELLSDIQNLFEFSILPHPFCDDSPFRILKLDQEHRWAGAAYWSHLVPDGTKYLEFGHTGKLKTPLLLAVDRFTLDFCNLTGLYFTNDKIASNFPGLGKLLCGQNIRRFKNPFRIHDLDVLRRLSIMSKGKSRSLLAKAEGILTLSSILSGFGLDLKSYAVYMSNQIGRISASLLTNGIIHRLLTSHCQNVTLAGELTEFDYSLIEDRRSFNGDSNYSKKRTYLYSQIILMANHVRCFADSVRWIGVEVTYYDMVEAFLLELLNCLNDSSLQKELIKHLKENPYCIDINLLIHDRHSYRNLSNAKSFMYVFRKYLHNISYKTI
ncbi:MAG: hypothetical protein HOI47_01655 [Candidatus Scalindua sp.]|jgi:hypothetical protein|nr:hypothetical protein [Candidatus Scalindua sp.]